MDTIVKLHLTHPVYRSNVVGGQIKRDGSGGYYVTTGQGIPLHIPRERVVAVEYAQEQEEVA